MRLIRCYYLLIIAILITSVVYDQTYTLSGYLTDSASNEFFDWY